jgi:molybdopterin molybdotransferase
MTMVQGAPWHEARLNAAQGWQVLSTEFVHISQGNGRSLAVDCPALCDLPTYPTSAMDGFAVAGAGPWRIVGEVKAGQPMNENLLEGTSVRIATGAVIPEGTLGVIRWEAAEVQGDLIHGEVTAGEEIRPAAHECKEGEILAYAGTILTPGWVGLLAAAGYDQMLVFKRPRVCLILLGDEIQLSGVPSGGLVRDALGPQLPGWLSRMGAEVISTEYVADLLDLVTTAVRDASAHCDLIITTGGTAEGPRDHLHSALANLSATLVVDKVKVRPGHPMLLASLPNKNGKKVPVLGLPGNPQSAIVALLTLGQPVINALLGRDCDNLHLVPTSYDIATPKDFTRLVLGNVVGGHFEMGNYLGSAMLRGLAYSSGFAIAEGGVTPAGTLVRWLPLP